MKKKTIWLNSTLLLTIGLFLVCSYTIQNQQENENIKIEVVNCQSSTSYLFEKDLVIIKIKDGDLTFSKVQADPRDIQRFSKAVDKLFINSKDEIFANPCTLDGFGFKVYLIRNKIKKKIFVSNFYEARIDTLLNIFNKYIDRENEILKYNAFVYPQSTEEIQEIIDDQKACKETFTKEMKAHLLNRFCE